MLILLVAISLILCVWLYVIDSQEGGDFFGIVFAILSIILLSVLLGYPYNIDDKLEMYAEENQAIETKIKETVQAYMNYEQETYKSLVVNADLQTLLIAYPELNSNELVKTEIETYKENNNKIKKLKEQKINRKVMGFWLFFNIGVKD